MIQLDGYGHLQVWAVVGGATRWRALDPGPARRFATALLAQLGLSLFRISQMVSASSVKVSASIGPVSGDSASQPPLVRC